MTAKRFGLMERNIKFEKSLLWHGKAELQTDEFKLSTDDLKLPVDDIKLPINNRGLAVDDGRFGIGAILAGSRAVVRSGGAVMSPSHQPI